MTARAGVVTWSRRVEVIPMRLSTLCGLVCGLAIVVLPIAGIALIVRNIDHSDRPPPVVFPRFDTTPEEVAGRRQSIERLQRSGIIGSVGSFDGWKVSVVVRDGFYALPYWHKELVMLNVWIFLNDAANTPLPFTLRDGRTNKKIGRFSYSTGLKLN